MFSKSVLIAFTTGCLLSFSASAQDGGSMKYGKVSKEDFSLPKFEKDTGAHAVILSEIGSSNFESDGNNLRLVFKIHRRIRVMDKNGYELATVEIPLYKNGNSEEKLLNLKAAAYNLENGEVVETKMESKNIFNDKQDKNLVVKKFAVPAVKEGTIIEYAYTVSSPEYARLRPWAFQGEYPILWSEYSVNIPEYFDYVFIKQGFEKFAVEKKETSRTHFSFRTEPGGYAGPSNIISVNPSVTTYQWAVKDAPPIRDENYVTTTRNYVNRVEFQLAAYNWPDQPRKPVQTTWPKLMEDLLKHEEFGASLSNNNGFLGDIVDQLTKDAKTDREKAVKIYQWVRDNYTCTDHEALGLDKSIKTVFNAKSGSVAEINLLLTAMLKRAKLEVYPIILSTRSHGYVYPYYPLLSRFNYTIAGVNLGDEFVTLDASEPLLGFNRLPADCYNGDARLVNEYGTVLSFASDSLHEQKFTSVIFGKIADGSVEGSFQQRPTYFESYGIRKQVREKSQDEYFKKIVKGYTGDINLSNKEIDDLKELDNPLLVKYDFKMKLGEGDVLYINPLFGESYKHNPFKSMERKFPVEMDAVYDEVYSFNMDVPEGYEVDEMPKPAIAKYNEDEGIFQYLIQQTESHIQLRCRVQLTKANFPPEEYPSLREFFDVIVKKQAEQIVLKKKK